MKNPLNRFLLSAFLIVPLFALAQEDDMLPITEDRLREIKAQKTAFLTQRLDLAPEEAEKFWPVYNQYDKEVAAVRKEMREFHKSMKADSAITEAEASAAIDRELSSRQKELDVRKKYVAQFKKTLGAVKMMELGKAERDFNKELVRRLRERKGERPEGGGRGPSGKP